MLQYNHDRPGLKLLIAGVAASAFMAASPAKSQAADGSQAAGADQVAETPTINQDEIIVTARRKSERLSEVPLSVASISPRAIESSGYASIEQLQRLTPNVQIGSPYGNAQPNYTIRGVGAANQYLLASASPIGFYVDEVYQTFRATQGLQLYDLDRIEVLKGPQGTLFGRNTTGGAITLYTRQPSLSGDANGYVQTGYGNYNRFTLAGATDATIIDGKLGLRIAGTFAKGDGYVHNVRGGDDFASVDQASVRAILRAKPTETLDVALTASYSRSNPISTPVYWLGLLPGNTNLFGVSREGLGLGRFDADCNDCGRIFADLFAVTLRAGLELNDAATITSITSYDTGNSRQFTDCDGSPVKICNYNTNIKGSSISQDIRLNYQGTGFNFVVGGYFGADELGHENRSTFFNGLAPFFNTVDQQRRTAALYAEGTVTVAPRFDLSAGVRLAHDVGILSNYQAFVLDREGGVPIANLVPSNNGGPLNTNLFVPTQRRNETYVPFRVIGKYSLGDDVMTYASFSHGFRSGNFNTQAFGSPSELVYIGPERANNYEVGLKATQIAGFLSVNVAGFYTDYKNQQVLQQIGINNSLVGLDGHIYGIEMDARARISSELMLRGSFGLLRSKYTDGEIGGSIGTTGVPAIFPVRGNPFPYAPRETFQVGFDWEMFSDRKLGSLTLISDLAYTGRFSYAPEGNASLAPNSTVIDGSDPYYVWDANLAYRRGKVELGLWIRNITNSFYLPYYVNTQSLGYDYLISGPPRTFGASAKFDF